MTPASTSNPPAFGLIGLGLMGGAFALRLLKAGHAVRGFDPVPSAAEALAAKGGVAAGTAEEVFDACEVILLSLPSHKEVSTVLAANEGRWRSGQIVVDTSTGEPEAAAENARKLAKYGVSYLDATISGSSAQVREGEVVWMVGGEKEAFERCADLFACVAKEAIHTGAAGTGAKMKLVTNLVLGLNRAALAEGLVFAQQLDLDPAQALDVMRRSMAYSRIMDTKGDKMITEDFSPQAKLSQHLKDVRLMLAASSLPLSLSETHCQLLEKAVAMGYGDLDNSAVIKAIGEPHA